MKATYPIVERKPKSDFTTNASDKRQAVARRKSEDKREQLRLTREYGDIA